MSLLIDGHNLIAQLADIRLDDPNDEALLVERLRRYQARTGKRIVVVFDGGLPGGTEPGLSTSRLEVVFAATGRSADDLIVARVRRSRDPRGLTVVTSDRKIMAAAQARGARILRADAFAAELSAALATSSAATEPRDVQLDEAEVEDWLKLFGEERQDRRSR